MRLPQWPSASALLLFTVTHSWLAAAAATEERLQAVSRELPFISLGDFLMDRVPTDYNGSGTVAKAWKSLAELRAPELLTSELIRLGAHQDPNMRALAILALVAKEQPDFIPVCLELANDVALTKPHQMEPGGRIPGETNIYTSPLTVGGIARKALSLVGFPGANNDDVSRPLTAPGWWEARQGNPDWLGWHSFLARRATQGTSPAPPSSTSAVQRHRKLIDALPPVTRAWLLLYLSEEWPWMGAASFDYATEAELLAAAKTLGSDALLEFLKTGVRTRLKDPSLDDRRGSAFIQGHAKQLFTPAHAPALMQNKLYLAAADADPRLIREVVAAVMKSKRSFSDSWGVARAMAALADLGDATDRATAAKWFYDEPNSDTGTTAQTAFIQELERRRPQEWRDTVKQIIAHPAFDQLRPLDVTYLAIAVGRLGGEHAIGDGRQYARGTEELVRQRLREQFKIPHVADQELPVPAKLAEKPEWSVPLGSLLGHQLALSADGKFLAVGLEEGRDGTGFRVFATADGRELFRTNYPGMSTRVVFTGPDSRLIAASLHSKELWLWSAQDGLSTKLSLPASDSYRAVVDGAHMVVINSSTISWLEFPAFKLLWKYPVRNRFPSHLATSPDACWIVAGDGFVPGLVLLDAQRGERQGALIGHSANSRKLAFSPDSQLVASVGDDNRLLVWNVATQAVVLRRLGRQPPRLAAPNKVAPGMAMVLSEAATTFGPIAFTADSRSVMVCPEQGILGVYAVAGGKPLMGFKLAGHRTDDVAGSADGQFLYTLIRTPSPAAAGAAWFDPPRWSSRVERWRLR